jgi:hypothetical protein
MPAGAKKKKKLTGPHHKGKVDMCSVCAFQLLQKAQNRKVMVQVGKEKKKRDPISKINRAKRARGLKDWRCGSSSRVLLEFKALSSTPSNTSKKKIKGAGNHNLYFLSDFC